MALLLLAPAAFAQEPSLPEGCRLEADLAVCEWRFDTRRSADLEYAWEIPVRAWTLATLTISLDGVDQGWQAQLRRGGDVESSTDHAPSGAFGVTRDTTIHLLVAEDDSAWTLTLQPHSVQAAGYTANFLGAPGGRSAGAFHVILVSEPLPAGVSPGRPAATREVPHLQDVVDYAAPPDRDLEAAWFDDPYVGDGLFTVSVAVRDLRNLSFEPGLLTTYHYYRVLFTVRDDRYMIGWSLAPRGEDVAVNCALSTRQGSGYLRIMEPRCALDRDAGILMATIPERSVGNPGRGEPFHDLAADSGSGNGASGQGADAIQGERFAFALGGPPVWDELNGGAFVEQVVPLAWHQAPLSEENLPDTLQVAGAVAATLTFLFGLLVVRRRRARTRRMLDEVDAVERAHERDAHRALLALGELESRFTRLFRDGDIHEAQYQVVSQRIASVATRFALRRELGLDDGEPGERAAVRVPVRGGEETRRAP